MYIPRTPKLIAFAMVATMAGCSFYTRPFTPLNGGPSGETAANTVSFDIDCRDTPKASGATSISGKGESAMNAGTPFYAACTYEGKPLPWKVLGVLHAGYSADSDWEGWRREAVANAKSEGCPGVALRTFPPTVGDKYDMVGALCVDPNAAPSAK